MGWVHATGYEPAYDHEGYAAAVLDDGTDTGTWSAETTGLRGERVTGWRAACSCGWRGEDLHRAEDYPGATGAAPVRVEGVEPGAAPPLHGRSCYAAWDAHLRRVLPELAVHDALADEKAGRGPVDRAVRAARAAGASWTAIGRAAGTTRQAAHERWHLLDDDARPPEVDPDVLLAKAGAITVAMEELGQRDEGEGGFYTVARAVDFQDREVAVGYGHTVAEALADLSPDNVVETLRVRSAGTQAAIGELTDPDKH
ncbi:hypothetical protein [Nocardiopsis baichengensis]|uniref:hypothetical protein n=1 Tax=Nocardiopsis baichengensis TaxID=280240 RepID=UPI000349B54C|nr:hypothetical protein [Nocardiopsis baichengensis]